MNHSRRHDPEYIAIILASTQGARLFPLTSEYSSGGVPKHLLPLSPLNSHGNVAGASGGKSGPGEGNEKDGHGAIPLLQRLLIRTYESGFEMVVVAIHKEDSLTIPFLLGQFSSGQSSSESGNSEDEGEAKSLSVCKLLTKESERHTATNVIPNGIVTDLEYIPHGEIAEKQTSTKCPGVRNVNIPGKMHVRVVKLPEDCHGSADALRFLSGPSPETPFNTVLGTDRSNSNTQSNPKEIRTPGVPESSADVNNSTMHSEEDFRLVPRTSHAVVMPGDLVLEGGLLADSSKSNKLSDAKDYDGKDVLSLLVDAHRRWNASGENHPAAAVTMLLTDVGAEDKEGVPLRESSKTKMGLLSREEEDMEYTGLSSETPPSLSSSLASLSYSRVSSMSPNGSNTPPPSRRVLFKRSKIEVEEDEGTGSTPKLSISKRQLHPSGGIRNKNNNCRKSSSPPSNHALSMLLSRGSMDHSPTITIRTDLHDVHLYAVSNWVLSQLLHARPNMASFQKEVLPLLISRQFRGIEAAFGPTALKAEENRERLRRVLHSDSVDESRSQSNGSHYKVSSLLGMYASAPYYGIGIEGNATTATTTGNNNSIDPKHNESPISGEGARPSSSMSSNTFPTTVHPYVISAQVLSRRASSLTLRACTIPSLLYGCREITSRTLKLDTKVSSRLVPKHAQLSTKFNSILLPGCSVGEKVQTKSCTIGKGVTLGDRARLNNVVVMDGAIVGENTILQNSVVGVGARIGENCNLNDCQVGPGAVVPPGTRTSEKGEAFHL